MKSKIFIMLLSSILFVNCKNKKENEAQELLKEMDDKRPDNVKADSLLNYMKAYSSFVKLDSLKKEMNNENYIDSENARLLYIAHLEKILDNLNEGSVSIQNEKIHRMLLLKMDSVQLEILEYRK